MKITEILKPGKFLGKRPTISRKDIFESIIEYLDIHFYDVKKKPFTHKEVVVILNDDTLCEEYAKNYFRIKNKYSDEDDFFESIQNYNRRFIKKNLSFIKL